MKKILLLVSLLCFSCTDKDILNQDIETLLASAKSIVSEPANEENLEERIIVEYLFNPENVILERAFASEFVKLIKQKQVELASDESYLKNRSEYLMYKASTQRISVDYSVENFKKIAKQKEIKIQIEKTKSCLINRDWLYPDNSNPIGAWKFSDDGKFNSSTKMFGGNSTWGTWSVISPNQIKIIYTRSSNGRLPDPNRQILKMIDCYTFSIGSTIYKKY